MISRFSLSIDDGSIADKNSELVLLEIQQPYGNHNGGQIAFGPDGYLYIAMGDGGSGGDPQGNGQNLKTLLGAILRIDVDNPENGNQYSIPENNPFADNTGGYKEEIYASGLRNPWRFSFDPVTGWLWAADVGQNKIEEIDIIEPGKNYGWNTMEGNSCYSPSANCDRTGLELPVWEYDHSSGKVRSPAVTCTVECLSRSFTAVIFTRIMFPGLSGRSVMTATVLRSMRSFWTPACSFLRSVSMRTMSCIYALSTE